MATAKKVAKKSPATKKVVKKVAKKTEGAYHLVIKVNGEVFECNASSILEGLKSFVSPIAIKTKVTVSVTKGSKSHLQIMTVFNARRAFNGSNTSLALLASNLEKFING